MDKTANDFWAQVESQAAQSSTFGEGKAQRIYYTTEYRLVNALEAGWMRDKESCYVRGTNIAGEFEKSELGELRRLVNLAQEEHEYSEYRIVKITETTEVEYLPPVKAVQLRFR